jgi:rhodanese-related sulfurtransferase
MRAPNTISVEKLLRLVGTPKCPTLIDVRAEGEFEADPRLIPSSRHCIFEKLEISSETPAHPAVVICQKGASLSQGVATARVTYTVLPR